MPTNENTYNSRVTSEALEAKFRQVFPSQGGAELVDDLYASGVIQPVIDFSSVAEGSVLPAFLQTAWDFSTGHFTCDQGTAQTIITNPGFWKVDWNWSGANADSAGATATADLAIFDGSTNKIIWELHRAVNVATGTASVVEGEVYIFLRAGDSLRGKSMYNNVDYLDVWYRQVADVNGNLVNPLGFTFS